MAKKGGRKKRGQSKSTKAQGRSQNGDAEEQPPRKRRPRKSWLATHGRDLKFLGIFLGLIALYYFATTTQFMSEQFFPWYLRLNADISVKFLNTLGYDVTVQDQSMVGAFRMQIARGCDGVDPSALFIAAVLASPAPFRRKIPAVLVGTGLLLVLNVVRIITLYFTGLYFPSLFDIAHLDVWQAAFIIMALLFWAIWAHRISKGRTRHAHAA